MQTSDAHKVATPENWRPGDKVRVPRPGSVDEANARVAAGEYECLDWYFRKESL
jgi:peroxiredoxin (alkyl hydroperoxide reductase subunit C)